MSAQKSNDPHALSSAQYFLDSEEAQRGRIEAFLGQHAECTEQDKIDYLLESIKTSDLTYVRNGDYFDGKKASRWLRWKMGHKQYKANPIDTADEFVNVVSVGSVKTGLPYQIRLPNGRFVKVRSILKTELKSLEDALISRAAAVSDKGLIADTEAGTAAVVNSLPLDVAPLVAPAPAPETTQELA